MSREGQDGGVAPGRESLAAWPRLHAATSTGALLLDTMSEDQFKFVSTAPAPAFLSVKAGMTVICGSSDSDDWWMADVLHLDGGARDPKVPTLFQVADVDDGTVRWVCADLVTHIVPRV